MSTAEFYDEVRQVIHKYRNCCLGPSPATERLDRLEAERKRREKRAAGRRKP